MSKLKTISDKLDYIAMGKLNVEQMEYICEINQEVNLKDREIERLNNIIKRLEEDLREMYLTFGEFSEEYTENRIKELKGSDKDVSFYSRI